jgi:hypothetical protein
MDYAPSQIVSKPRQNGTTFVQTFWGTPSSTGYHWTSTLSGASTRSNFLSFAVQSHLFSYVQAKLDDDDTVDCSELLFTAIWDYRISPSSNDCPSCIHKVPSAPLIRLLLKHGADPNRTFFGSTLWERVLDQMPRPSRAENALWRDIIASFEKHGADSSNREKREIIEDP